MVYIKPFHFDVIFYSAESTLMEPRQSIVLSLALIVGPSLSARSCMKYLEYLYEKLVFFNLYLHVTGSGVKAAGAKIKNMWIHKSTPL